MAPLLSSAPSSIGRSETRVRCRSKIATTALVTWCALLGFGALAGTESGFTSPFNGKNLEGWTMQEKAAWTVEDGVLVGRPEAGATKDSWLFTEAEWSDFVLELDFKVTEHCNTGIALRMPKEKSGSPDMSGYEMQICDVQGMHPTGSLLHHIDSKENNVHKVNEWNHLKVTCEGEHIVILLNDKTMLDTKEKGSKKGRIGMQVALGKDFEKMVASFKNIRIKSLAPAPRPRPRRRSRRRANVGRHPG
jgi:hypothetical protein